MNKKIIALSTVVFVVLVILMFVIPFSNITGFSVYEEKIEELNINMTFESNSSLLLTLDDSPTALKINGYFTGKSAQVLLGDKIVFEIGNETTLFQNKCVDTCELTDIDSEITLDIIVDGFLIIDSVEYSYDLNTTKPVWASNKTSFTFDKDETVEIDLNDYFAGNNLTYLATGASNLTVEIMQSVLKIIPDIGFVGQRMIKAIASDEINTVEQELRIEFIETNVTANITANVTTNITTNVSVNATTNETNATQENITKTFITLDGKVKDINNKTVGKKIKNDVEFDVIFTNITKTNYSLDLIFYHNSSFGQWIWIKTKAEYNISGKYAQPFENITLAIDLIEGIIPKFELKLGEASEIFEFGKKIPKIYKKQKKHKKIKTKKANESDWYELIDRDDEFLDVEIVLNNTKVIIKGVNASDINSSTGIVSDSMIKTDVFAADSFDFENATIILPKKSRITTIVHCSDIDLETLQCNSSWTPVNIPFIDDGENITFTVFNFSGYAGAEIEILNVQSYPMLFGNWTVMFNTTGTANLTITAFNSTTWHNVNETEDLKFLLLKCGNQTLNYSWINDSVFIENFNCNFTSNETSKVLTAKKHTLQFTFGNTTKYAYNDVPTHDIPYIGAHQPIKNTIDPDLVSYWQFEGEDNRTFTAVDSVNINNGSLNPDIQLVQEGRIGSAFEFDGITDHINVSDDASLDMGTGDFSLAFWMKTAGQERQALISKMEDNSIGSTPRWTLTKETSGALEMYINDGASAIDAVTNSNTFDSGFWHHVVVVVDRGTGVTFYKDGGFDRTVADSDATNTLSNNGKFIIGHRDGGLYMNGTLDEIMFFNKTLSAGEAYELYLDGRINATTEITSDQSLGASSNNTADADSDETRTIYNWNRNGTSFANLNLPFETNSSTTSTDYTPWRHNVTVSATWNDTGRNFHTGSYQFDGDNDHINVTHHYSLAPIDKLSVAFWAKADKSVNWQVMLSKDYANGYLFAWDDGDQPYFSVNIEGTAQDAIAQSSVDTNWHHYTGTYNGSIVSLYIDGVWVNSTNATGNITYQGTPEDVQIGYRTDGVYFNGTIDEILIYNQSLSAEQVRALYNLETNRIVENETSEAEEWSAKVTINDNSGNSTTYETENITIINKGPEHDNPIVNSTDADNASKRNLTVHEHNLVDADSEPLKNITTWFVNDTSIMVLNMPFEGGSVSGDADGVTNAAKDYSPWTNNGTAVNVTWSATSGYDGKGAYDFNDPRNYINATNDPGLDITGDITISMWFKPRKVAGYALILKGGCFGGTKGYCIQTGSDGTPYFKIDGTGRITGTIKLDDTSKWYHIVVTKNSVGSYMYTNGNTSGSGASAAITSNSNSLMIGGRADSGFANGTIDDVQIYNRSLSTEQIEALYQNRTHILVANETRESEIWRAQLTPNDGTKDGFTLNSNNLTIGNSAPIHTTPVISSADGTNRTTQNLTVTPQNVADIEGETIKNITNWYMNGTSITVLNMPFEGGSVSGSEAGTANAVKDYSGFENNGTVANATWNPGAGVDGFGAYEFPGEADIIIIPHSSSLNLGAVGSQHAISGWVKYIDGYVIISKTDSGADAYPYSCYIASNLLDCYTKGTDTNPVARSTTLFNDGAWHHFVFNVDKLLNESQLYVDGSLEDTASHQYNGSFVNTLNTGIGSNPSGTPWVINATIDEILIFNRTLSPEQVQSIFQNRTNRIVANETLPGENWSACVIPNDGEADAIQICSENLTIKLASGNPPTQSKPILNSTDGYNTSLENLTIYNQSTNDVDGDSFKNIINWYKDGISTTVLNMPFEGGSLNGTAGGLANAAKDYSPYVNNGTATNATWNATGGHDGKGAYMFNRVNDSIDIPQIDLGGDFALTFWAKPNSSTTYQIIFDDDDETSGRGGVSVNSGWALRETNANGKEIVRTSSFDTSNWQFVAFTQTGTTARAYYNGVQEDIDDDGSFVALTKVDTIGYGASISEFGYNGSLDDIMIFNRSLSTEQIVALYNNRTNIITANETQKGDGWKGCITPNDGGQDGGETCSDSLYIEYDSSGTGGFTDETKRIRFTSNLTRLLFTEIT